MASPLCRYQTNGAAHLRRPPSLNQLVGRSSSFAASRNADILGRSRGRTVGAGRLEALQAEISDHDYETKVAGLLERAWRRDVDADSAAADTYREAFRALNQGDHYILIMIARALGGHLHPWWAFWR